MRRLVLLLWLTAGAALAGLPVRVGVISYDSVPESELIARELSTLDGVVVVRGTGELPPGATLASLRDEDRRALGEKWQVPLLLLVEKNTFRYVDAEKGEDLFRIREDTPEKLAWSARVLVEELRDALRAEEPSLR